MAGVGGTGDKDVRIDLRLLCGCSVEQWGAARPRPVTPSQNDLAASLGEKLPVHRHSSSVLCALHSGSAPGADPVAAAD